MRLLHVLVLMGLGLSSIAQDNDSSAYANADRLLLKHRSGTLAADEKKELKNLVYGIQNKGFILEEYHRDYKGSLAYINKALDYWKALDDTMNVANLHKYKGLLLGYLGEFDEAKKECYLGMQLFGLKGYNDGVAVSWFDLAQVFRLEHNTDSAMFYAEKVYDHWKGKSGKRISAVERLMLALYIERQEFEMGEEMQGKLAEAVAHDTHWIEQLDVYYLSYWLYREMKQPEKADNYQRLYQEAIKRSTAKGSGDRSKYDN